MCAHKYIFLTMTFKWRDKTNMIFLIGLTFSQPQSDPESMSKLVFLRLLSDPHSDILHSGKCVRRPRAPKSGFRTEIQGSEPVSAVVKAKPHLLNWSLLILQQKLIKL